mgnify:CR=1 FL=1
MNGGSRRSRVPQCLPHFVRLPVVTVVEKVRQFAFADEPFTIENEEMTPSMKIRRHKIKERYGKNTAGQRMLLSRRLVEAGVRFVSMTYGGWDMHQNIEAGFNRQGPELDQAFATLISDLDETGMLDSTLVMMSSEFGRTPKINKDSGRDHYPRVFSVVLAGGGIARGQVYGSSDAFATAPEENPLSVEDLATTVYDRIGIVADKELMAPGDRPMEIVDGGKVIPELLA